jgi:hypothetical protein
MRLLWFIFRAGVTVGATLVVYGYAHGIAARVFAGPFDHLNQAAIVMVSATLAGMVGVALAGALSRWNL